LAFGLIGFAFARNESIHGTSVLAIVWGDLLDKSFRRGMTLFQMVIYSPFSPAISAFLALACLLMLLVPSTTPPRGLR